MVETQESPAIALEKRLSIPGKPISSISDDSQQASLLSEDVDHRAAGAGNNYDKQASRRRRPWENDSNRLWFMEIGSLAIAFIAFIAIIITLAMHQDRPLPHWPSLISINTLVAIFTAIMKAAMLLPIAEGVSQLKWLWFHHARPLIDLDRFDSASRGPWGCLLLILKRHTSQLAALGALVTIVAMAIDPFTQQVIQYDYCSTAADSALAHIPLTNNYTAGTRDNNGGADFLSGAMNAALYTGIFEPPANASANVRFDCATGNCTFPATDDAISYMSLAMCHSCTDISDQISVRNGTEDGEKVVNHVLPSGLTIGGSILSNTTWIEGGEPGQNTPFVNSTLFTFEMMMIMPSNLRVWASRCSLTPCVKSYGANITNGVLEEHEMPELSVPLQFLPAAAGDAYFSIFTNSSVVGGKVLSCEPTNHPTERNTLPMSIGLTWITAAYLDDRNYTPPYYPPECAFSLLAFATGGIESALYNTLGNQTIEDFSTTYYGQPWMIQLFDNGNATPETLSNNVRGLADAISAAFRNGGDTFNSVPAAGTVLVSQTCIRVHWPWLALPASLLLLSSLFLAATIWQTSRDNTGKGWKSSSLPLLFHGLSEETIKSLGSVGNLGEMNESARSMMVQLRWEDGGWRFRELDKEEAVT